MKIKMILSAAIAAGVLAGCASEKNSHNTEAKMAGLLEEAKITKADAQQTALAKGPNGTVKDGELERENGKLIWSFDITIPDSKDIKEVAVDAMTGDVAAVETETPADQAREAAEDAAKAKKGKDKEDKDLSLI
jgi:Peptidase propeptide and YPEB domain